MIKLLRSHKAQIRGIDFSLAMIIFLLTMTQIMILTTNFINANRSHLTRIDEQENVYSLSNQIIFNYGDVAGSDWATSPTSALSGSWNFGIAGDNGANPFKLGRLSNWTLTSMKLDYDTVARGLRLSDQTVKIEILSSITVEINSIDSTSLPTLNITGSVYKNQVLTPNVDIYIYTVDASNFDVSQAYTNTNTTGLFSVSMSVTNGATLSNTYLSVIVIAKFGSASADVCIEQVSIGTPSSLSTSEIYLSEASSHASGYSVDVQTTRNTGSAVLTAFYPGLDQSSQNYTQTSTLTSGVDSSSNPIWTASDFAIPENGIVFFIVHEVNAGTTTHMGYISFPVALNNDISKSFGPATEPSAVSSVTTHSILVRGLILNMKITLWEA